MALSAVEVNAPKILVAILPTIPLANIPMAVKTAVTLSAKADTIRVPVSTTPFSMPPTLSSEVMRVKALRKSVIDLLRLSVSTLGVISFSASANFGSTSDAMTLPAFIILSSSLTVTPAALAIACMATGIRSAICRRSSSACTLFLLIICDRARNTPF